MGSSTGSTKSLLALLALAAALWAGCAPHPRARTTAPPIQQGTASWYGSKFHGRATASGEIYDMHQLTAAHRTLPLGTRVLVVNLDNGRSVSVRINDRGPFIRGRIIDLSYAAARELDMVAAGLAKVAIYLEDGGDRRAVRTRYAVQVGAFRTADRAQGLRDELARRYRGVVVRSVDGWHRVQVGSFRRQPQARSLQRDLERRGLPAVIVELR